MKRPPINLDYLQSLTDDTGILQHAKYSIPNRREGYTTDDNARALLVCVKHHLLFSIFEIEKSAAKYLAFLLHMQRSDGKFHNLLSYERRFMDQVGSEDCMGRALWVCGSVINSNLSNEKKLLSKEIFDKCLPWVNGFTSLRAKAYTIIGLTQYQTAFPDDHNLTSHIRVLTNHLCTRYEHVSSVDWRWFESYFTYANARLPQALANAYITLQDKALFKIGKESFAFLIENQIRNNRFSPFGNQGWYIRSAKRSLYDQQPLEAAGIVDAAATLFHITGETEYLKIATLAFDWFLGKNSRNVQVYNSRTGSCYDGITPQGLNLNQGAESTLSYLLARLEMERLPC